MAANFENAYGSRLIVAEIIPIHKCVPSSRSHIICKWYYTRKCHLPAFHDYPDKIIPQSNM
jgi:hypothetical protein